MTPAGPPTPPRADLLKVGRGLALLALSLVPVVCGVILGVAERRTLTAAGMRPESGVSYVTGVQATRLRPLLSSEGDTLYQPTRSGATLFENGSRLGPPHTVHGAIRGTGLGRYSHWSDTLYFSTSDNSDPRTNGRRYDIDTVAWLPNGVVWLWIVCVALAASGRLRTPFRLPRTARGLAEGLLALATVVSFAVVIGSARGLTWPELGRHLEVAFWGLSVFVSLVLAVRGGRLLQLVDVLATLDRLDAPFQAEGGRGLSLRALTLIAALLPFAAVLLVELPAPMLAASYGLTLPIVAWAGLPFALCLSRRHGLGLVGALAIAVTLFALPLRALWQDVATHGSAVGGLLPLSDASGYYTDALRLLSGEPLGWTARRPLFVGLLSTLLAATGRNLQWSIALMVLLNAVAAFLLAREWRASFGPVAGALVLLLSFLFYRVDGGLGTTLTENLGLALAALAFAAIARGVRMGDPRGYCLGLGLLTVALMARAGAFFVLPALVCAAAWEFRRHPGRLRIGAGAIASVLVAAMLSLGVGKVLAKPVNDQQAFSNFSYVIYGLVVGGKGWGQVLVDHPGAREGNEIYALAWQAFQARPMGLVEGSVKVLKEYLGQTDSLYHGYAFVRDGLYTRDLQDTCYTLAGLGLLASALLIRRPLSGVLLAGTVGHLASIPFLPPSDAGLRVYSATMPLVILLTAFGAAMTITAVAALARRFRPSSLTAAEAVAPAETGRFAQHLGLGVAVVVMAGPIALLWLGRGPVQRPPTCPVDQEALQVRLADGSFLAVTDDAGISAAATQIRRRDLRPMLDWFMGQDAGRLRPGMALHYTVDLATGRGVWLVLPRETGPTPPGLFAVCGRTSRDPQSGPRGVFYAHSLWRVGSVASGS